MLTHASAAVVVSETSGVHGGLSSPGLVEELDITTSAESSSIGLLGSAMLRRTCTMLSSPLFTIVPAEFSALPRASSNSGDALLGLGTPCDETNSACAAGDGTGCADDDLAGVAALSQPLGLHGHPASARGLMLGRAIRLLGKH
mmetsp:Transcript_47930/g.121651  ORF Transcript_47930/g.121651 Transcript_47930/m.121651 type:complete len:144 (+) Transcript_47930:789-1220(+)